MGRKIFLEQSTRKFLENVWKASFLERTVRYFYGTCGSLLFTGAVELLEMSDVSNMI